LLRAARTVPEFLKKESERGTGFKSWVIRELASLSGSDARYKNLITLRNVSAHDCYVQPDRGDITVEVSDQMTASGSFAREVRDAQTGKVIAHEEVFAPPEIESTLGSTKVRIKYYLKDFPQEDAVTFCSECLCVLESLVNRAHVLFP
jgi:hypothetical protein